MLLSSYTQHRLRRPLRGPRPSRSRQRVHRRPSSSPARLAITRVAVVLATSGAFSSVASSAVVHQQTLASSMASLPSFSRRLAGQDHLSIRSICPRGHHQALTQMIPLAQPHPRPLLHRPPPPLVLSEPRATTFRMTLRTRTGITSAPIRTCGESDSWSKCKPTRPTRTCNSEREVAVSSALLCSRSSSSPTPRAEAKIPPCGITLTSPSAVNLGAGQYLFVQLVANGNIGIDIRGRG